jgi:hypothetical protein
MAQGTNKNKNKKLSTKSISIYPVLKQFGNSHRMTYP